MISWAAWEQQIKPHVEALAGAPPGIERYEWLLVPAGYDEVVVPIYRHSGLLDASGAPVAPVHVGSDAVPLARLIRFSAARGPRPVKAIRFGWSEKARCVLWAVL